MKKPKFTTSAAITAVVLLSLASAGTGVTHAATSPDGDNPAGKLVTAIAQKFNLNESEVQKVFDAQREQVKTQHEQKALERLAQAVKDGKITQAQADALIAKKKEMREFAHKGGPRMGNGHPRWNNKGFGDHGIPKSTPRAPTALQ